MREFWHRFCTNRYWFCGTMLVLFVLFMFFWHLFDRVGYTIAINSFLKGIWTICEFFLTLAIIVLVFMLMFRIGPFKRKSKGSGH